MFPVYLLKGEDTQIFEILDKEKLEYRFLEEKKRGEVTRFFIRKESLVGEQEKY